MKRIQAVLLAALVSIASWAAEPQTDVPTEKPQGKADQGQAEQVEEKPMSFWMEKKLEHSQAILRGLAMGDFEDVKYNAGRLKVLNRVEGFVRRKNPDYRAHLNTFSRVSAEIERQAVKQNIEGATLAFNQLTVSCVECHKSLRHDAAAAGETVPESTGTATTAQ